MIRQIERADDPKIALDTAFRTFASTFWVALPAIVQSYDAAKGTVTVLPAIQFTALQEDGSRAPIELRPIPDVPVVVLGGGGFVATFPIQAGDEALVIFADRCIDAWWQSGKVSPQAELRMHSLSDGFAIIGPRSLPKAIPNASPSSAQLRSIDGSTYVEVAAGRVVNVVAPAGINLTGPVMVEGNLSVIGTTTGQGDFSVTGKITASGDGVFSGHSVANHKHGGVQTGTDETGTAVG